MFGKFEGNANEQLAEALYDLCGDSWWNESHGSISEGEDWYGLFLNVTPLGGKTSNYIVCEDTQGFFTYKEYESKEEILEVWKGLTTPNDP